MGAAWQQAWSYAVSWDNWLFVILLGLGVFAVGASLWWRAGEKQKRDDGEPERRYRREEEVAAGHLNSWLHSNGERR